MYNLIKGDCLETMKDLSDNSINLIACDLPYGTTANRWDTVIPLDKLWKEYERLLAPKGNIVLFGQGLFSVKLIMSNEKLFRYDMVWKKSKCGSPFTAKYMPLKKHEMILIFGHSAATYNPQMSEGEPYKRVSKTGTNNMKYGAKSGFVYGSDKRHPITVLDYPQKWRRQDQLHPTQKPVELMEFIVKSYSNEDEVVLDNCMGSGTTGVACKNTNRQFIGIEMDEKYFEIADERINKEQTIERFF